MVTLLLLRSCAGESLAVVSGDAVRNWTLADVLVALPERFRSRHVLTRVFCDIQDLVGENTLSAVGAADGGQLTIVMSKKLLQEATASDDGRVKIWSAESGGSLRTLAQHHRADGTFEPVYSAVFSLAGERLVSASDDMTAKIYKIMKVLHMVAETDEIPRSDLADSGNAVPFHIALETPQDCTVSLTVEGRCTGFPKEEAWHSCRRRALSAHLSDIHQDHGARRAHQHVRTHQQLGDPQA